MDGYYSMIALHSTVFDVVLHGRGRLEMMTCEVVDFFI